MKVRGQWMYLYRAIGNRGETLDIHLSPKQTRKRVFMVGASRLGENVTCDDVDLFASDPFDVFSKLERDAGGALEDRGFIIFQTLGIALTGVHDGAEQERAVTLSVLGEWEALDGARTIIFRV